MKGTAILFTTQILGYNFHTSFQVRPVCVMKLRFLVTVKVYRGHTMY